MEETYKQRRRGGLVSSASSTRSIRAHGQNASRCLGHQPHYLTIEVPDLPPGRGQRRTLSRSPARMGRHCQLDIPNSLKAPPACGVAGYRQEGHHTSRGSMAVTYCDPGTERCSDRRRQVRCMISKFPVGDSYLPSDPAPHGGHRQGRTLPNTSNCCTHSNSVFLSLRSTGAVRKARAFYLRPRGAGFPRLRPRLLASWAVAALMSVGIGQFMVTNRWPVDVKIRHLLAAVNCSTARAVGLAPSYRGEPGYHAKLDRDDDGIACEPYPRR